MPLELANTKPKSPKLTKFLKTIYFNFTLILAAFVWYVLLCGHSSSLSNQLVNQFINLNLSVRLLAVPLFLGLYAYIGIKIFGIQSLLSMPALVLLCVFLPVLLPFYLFLLLFKGSKWILTQILLFFHPYRLRTFIVLVVSFLILLVLPIVIVPQHTTDYPLFNKIVIGFWIIVLMIAAMCFLAWTFQPNWFIEKFFTQEELDKIFDNVKNGAMDKAALVKEDEKKKTVQKEIQKNYDSICLIRRAINRMNPERTATLMFLISIVILIALVIMGFGSSYWLLNDPRL